MLGVLSARLRRKAADVAAGWLGDAATVVAVGAAVGARDAALPKSGGSAAAGGTAVAAVAGVPSDRPDSCVASVAGVPAKRGIASAGRPVKPEAADAAESTK